MVDFFCFVVAGICLFTLDWLVVRLVLFVDRLVLMLVFCWVLF